MFFSFVIDVYSRKVVGWQFASHMRTTLVLGALRMTLSTRERVEEVDFRQWIDTWNENPRPYVWINTAEQILDAISRYCQRINQTGH